MFPVRLDEDGHEIVNASGFWLEALLHLAHAARDVDNAVAEELAATRADLAARWDEEDAADQARTAVVETSYRLDRHIVVSATGLLRVSDRRRAIGFPHYRCDRPRAVVRSARVRADAVASALVVDRRRRSTDCYRRSFHRLGCEPASFF